MIWPRTFPLRLHPMYDDADHGWRKQVRSSEIPRIDFIKRALCHCVSVLGIIQPCLPSPAKVPPSGPGQLHEIKHDGFRIIARRDSAGVRLISEPK
jgi:ATP-dependent DNA ligase